MYEKTIQRGHYGTICDDVKQHEEPFFRNCGLNKEGPARCVQISLNSKFPNENYNLKEYKRKQTLGGF